MKRILSISLIAILTVTFCSCTREEAKLDTEKVLRDISVTYHVNAGENYVYDNTYSVFDKDGKITVASYAEAPYEYNGEVPVSGVQRIKSETVLSSDTLKPIRQEQSYTNTAEEGQYTGLVAEFFENYATITTTKLNSELKEESKLYTVSLNGNYFDKDTLPFIINGLSRGSINLFASNRDKIQSVKIEKSEETVLVQVEAGDFNCIEYTLKPNTVFSVYGAKMYVDSVSGICVKIQQEDSVSELVSINN